MAYRLRIDRPDAPPLYVASANCTGFLTADRDDARRIRSTLNAAELEAAWRQTLRTLGIAAEFTVITIT